jgi:hypothetical protein
MSASLALDRRWTFQHGSVSWTENSVEGLRPYPGPYLNKDCENWSERSRGFLDSLRL